MSLKEAKDKGFVNVIGGGEKAGHYGRKPYIYESTIEGINLIKEKGSNFL